VPRLAAATVLAVVVFGALGCGRSSAPTVDPATAAQTLASVYKLSTPDQQCLKAAFTAHRAATRPLAANKPASDTDLAALGAVARSCVPTSTLATAILGAADQDNALTATQRACLRTAVGALSPADQSTLLAGLAVPTALSDLQTALLGRVTDGLLNTCKISISGVTEQGTTPTT
jgi:uncharacterized membrane protein